MNLEIESVIQNNPIIIVIVVNNSLQVSTTFEVHATCKHVRNNLKPFTTHAIIRLEILLLLFRCTY